MKKQAFIFSLFFACTIVVNAQQITSTSTAGDCVNFINKVAQTGTASAKKYNYIRTVYFTGGGFIESQDWGSIIARITFSNMNWADFEKIKINKPETAGEDITFEFIFKTRQISYESFYIRKATNFVDDRKNETENTVYFYISPSEEGKIKELELAANRLKQIVTEKGNIFKTKTTASKIKNIDGKPSFQETITYINTFLEDGKNNDMFCNGVRYKERLATVGEHINGNVYLICSYVKDVYQAYEKYTRTENYKIDLSKVEEIKVVTGEGFPGGCLQVGLWFVEKGKSATPVMHLPLWNTSYDGFNALEFKKGKICQAFEHLRKLCGASDPIEF